MANSEAREYLSRIGIQRIQELDTALIEVFGSEEGERHIKNLTELFDRAEMRLIYGTEESDRGNSHPQSAVQARDGLSPKNSVPDSAHKKDSLYLRRQSELVDYLNQNLSLSLLASSYYDRIFFQKAMDYLIRAERYFKEDICEVGCGNGILTCFLAQRYPDSAVTGLDLSANAVSVAKVLKEQLAICNAAFYQQDISDMDISAQASSEPALSSLSLTDLIFNENPSQNQKQEPFQILLSCRTIHENVAWPPLAAKQSQKSCPENEENETSQHQLSLAELTALHRPYAQVLANLVNPGGYLISVERYEADSSYDGLLHALEEAGFSREKGTHEQFSCKNGDETATFQAIILKRVNLQ
ncbi:MAG: class I SAM-dependent methyltransferase [Lachnospiraceae bacterium]|nr:class I SAM-dependent methyltransferase [Lachnospiraceae bacterium]